MRIQNAGSYAATVVGFILGGIGCGILGAIISAQLERDGASVESIGILMIGGVVGGVVGSIIGSWGLLRVCAYPAAGRTAKNIAVGWIFSGGLFVSGEFGAAGALWLLLVLSVGGCCGARWLALASSTP